MGDLVAAVLLTVVGFALTEIALSQRVERREALVATKFSHVDESEADRVGLEQTGRENSSHR